MRRQRRAGPASTERLREAVAAGRVVPYSTQAFRGLCRPGEGAQRRRRQRYRPDRIYGRSSSNNAIGTIVGSAGEAGSSRGFLSETDAAMIAAAMAGDGSKFAASAARARDQMCSTDCRFPISSSGHRAITRCATRKFRLPATGPIQRRGPQPAATVTSTKANGARRPTIRTLAKSAQRQGMHVHTRDEAHLFNHGFAYWLATGDPRAAILQQAIAAYALASNYQRRRGAYLPRFGYQRTTLNQFSALWKLRDVAENASTARGQMIWPKPRARKIADDMWRGWKQRLGQLDASQHNRRPLGIDRSRHRQQCRQCILKLHVAGLWTGGRISLGVGGRAGAACGAWLNISFCATAIGGARGHFGTGSGSGFPVLKDGRMPYDRQGWRSWRGSTPIARILPTASMPPTVLRGYWSLQFARDAIRRWMPPVPGLDAAIARTERARDAALEVCEYGQRKHAAVLSVGMTN